MTLTLLQMALIIACGLLWRLLNPAGISAQQARHVLASLVFYLFLPALVLEVLWRANIGAQSVYYTVLGVSSSIAVGCLAWLAGRWLKFKPAQMGAVILATSFANVTFLGLPMLEQLFGSWARAVAIQIDFFAVSPMLYTLGVMVARHFGADSQATSKSLWLFFNTPPFWAVLLAVTLNLSGIAPPVWIETTLHKLSAAVIPLMLVSLGLALSWKTVQLNQIPFVLVVSYLKLLVMPWLAFELVAYLALPTEYKAAAVMDLAMPSMLMGVVFCDRYQLDSALYAMLVSVTTLLSLVTLPFWYSVVWP